MAYIAPDGSRHQPGDDIDDTDDDDGGGGGSTLDDGGADLNTNFGDSSSSSSSDSGGSSSGRTQTDDSGTPFGYLRAIDNIRGIDTSVGEVPETGDIDDSVGVTSPADAEETDETSSNSGGITINATTRTSTDRIVIEGEVSGALGAGFRDITSGGDSANLVFVPQVAPSVWGSRQANELVDSIQQAKEIVQTYPSALPQEVNDIVPDRLSNINAVSLDLKVDMLGQKISGESPVSFRKEIDLSDVPPVRIPTFADSPDIDDLPPLQIQLQVKPKEWVQRSFQNNPSVTVEVPADTFIQEVPLSNFDCQALFDDLDSRIDDASASVSSAQNVIRNQIDELTDVRSDFRQAQNELEQLANNPSADLESTLRGRLEEFQDRVTSVTTNPFETARDLGSFNSLRELQSFVEEARNNATENVARVGGCVNEFNGRLNNLETNVQNLRDRIQSLRAEKEDLLSELREVGLPSCVERFSDVDERISGYESQVGVGSASPDFERPIGITTRRSVLQELQSLNQELQSTVGEESSCFNEFRSRVETAQSRLKRFDVDYECGQRFSSIDSDLSEMEGLVGVGDRTPEIGQPVEASRITTIGDKIGSLSSRINDQIDDSEPCKSGFQSRLQAIAQQATNIQVQDVRDFDPDDLENIEAELPPELAATIRSLQSTIESLQDRIEERENDTELPGGGGGGGSLPGGGIIGPGAGTCSDAPRQIRNRVATFREDVDHYTSKNRSERAEGRRTELLNEAGDLRQQVKEQVPDGNACEEELLSRLDQFESTLRSTEVRTEQQVPCSQRYSDIDQQVRSFERDVINMRRPVPPGQLDNLISQGEELVESIREDMPDGDSCESAFVGSVESAMERISGFEQRLNITAEGIDEARQERRSRVQELIDELEELEG